MKSLDAFLPTYEFSTRHEVRVGVDPARADRALREVTFKEVPLVRGLLLARGLGLRSAKETVLAAMVPRATVLEDVPGEGLILTLSGQFWRLRGRGPEAPATAVIDFRALPGSAIVRHVPLLKRRHADESKAPCLKSSTSARFS